MGLNENTKNNYFLKGSIDMIKKTVEVVITKEIEVEIDETKFDDKFMKEFNKHFYKMPTIEDHIKNLAEMKAREIYSGYNYFEGYGNLTHMNIKLCETREDVDSNFVD